MGVLNDSLLSCDSMRPEDVYPGLLCSAMCSVDESWYRVLVVSSASTAVESSNVGPAVNIGIDKCSNFVVTLYLGNCRISRLWWY